MKAQKHESKAENLFYLVQRTLTVTLFFLIVLGAGVRIANAGLACPDWPFCFGKAVPVFNFQIFMEWIHRVIAGVSGILALGVSVFVLSGSRLRKILGSWVVASLLLFLVQAFLGRQTVLLLLHASTVSAHLVGGYALFAVNFFIWRRWRSLRLVGETTHSSTRSRAGRFVLILWGLSFFQALLGARVSSHYAGPACSDFPTCHGEWWPGFSGLIGIHFMHRLGAYTLLAAAFYYFRSLSKATTQTKDLRKIAQWGLALILLQIVWGVSMVFSFIHPALSLAHSATSLSIFAVYLTGVIRAYRGA